MIQEQRLGPRAQQGRFLRRLGRHAVAGAHKPIVDREIHVRERPAVGTDQGFHLGQYAAHFSLDCGRWIVGADADHARVEAMQRAPGDEAGLRAAGRCCMDDDVRCAPFAKDLANCNGIGGGTERGRRAKRNHEGAPALRAQLGCGRLHRRTARFAASHIPDLRSEQTIQQGVRGGRGRRHAVCNEDASHPETRGDRSGGAGVIGLNAAAGDQRVCTGRPGVRRNELQLAYLVAAESERNRVITLGQENGTTAQSLAQAVQPIEGWDC